MLSKKVIFAVTIIKEFYSLSNYAKWLKNSQQCVNYNRTTYKCVTVSLMVSMPFDKSVISFIPLLITQKCYI